MPIVTFACVIVLGCWSTFGLGGSYPNVGPVHGGSPWPDGMTSLINVTNRVSGYFVNQEDLFFYTGTTADFTAFLRDYSKIQGVEKHLLILHDGVGEAKAPWDNGHQACDWKLYGCPKGWLNIGVLSRAGTNSVEALREAAKDTNYVLEVHVWIGGHVALDKVTIPENVEVRRGK